MINFHVIQRDNSMLALNVKDITNFEGMNVLYGRKRNIIEIRED